MSDSEDDAITDISNPDVMTQYKMAAEITNKALVAVVAAAKAGAKVVDVCAVGDKLIEDECAKVFKSKEMEKGIAFPTCVSINSVIGHFSPLSTDTTVIANGDLLKVDLGCHINGYIATGATTVVVQAVAGAVTGRQADVIAAANTCFEAVLRLVRPGKKNTDVSDKLQKIAEAFGCNVVEGVMTHQMDQFLIDGEKCVLNKPSPDQKMDEQEFEENEVYAVDIVVSTGEGKSRVLDEKATTVYKRNLEVEYQLRMKNSRAVFAEIGKKYPAMPFSVRGLESEANNIRFGLIECITHGLLQPYPVLHEKEGELVAQIKGTVLLTKKGCERITTFKLQPVQTDKKVTDEEILALLKQSLKTKKDKVAA